MTLHQKPLYQMLSLARGSWRNSVYIECNSCPYGKELCKGHLLLTDADGTPILFSVSQTEKELGETIEKTECVATLTRPAFEHLYNRWLIWNINNPKECSIQQLLS